MQAVTITQISPNELTELIENAVKKALLGLKNDSNKKEEYISRARAAEILDVDISTLYLWNKKKILVPFGIGNRVYYRLSDIEAALKPLNK